MLRVGIGYDVHRFAQGRKLILGGVEIPYEKGLLGHSDADVLLHAICDALLGAAGLKDIGHHFPDYDEQWKDVSSSFLLEKTLQLLRKHHWKIVNIDATIIAEQPRLAPFIPTMIEHLSTWAAIAPQQINIKATTNEQMGFIGRGEGIAAIAIALIQKQS